MGVTVRPAQTDDALGIAHAHFASVHGTGSRYYSNGICDEWAPGLSADRIEQFAKAIESVEEILFVAEVQSLIAGFASIVPKSSELRAVYVDPKFGRRGVGKALLARVESEARERGLIRLTMNASLSAEEFYLSQGYVELERIDHTLKSGSQMPAIKMAKALA